MKSMPTAQKIPTLPPEKLPELPKEIWKKICDHLDDEMRLEWWYTLSETEKEYEEWPLCGEDHYDMYDWNYM